jgi:hypothetical protein
LHREDAKDAKKDKSKRKNAVFRNKIGFSSFLSSSLRSLRLRGAKQGSSCNTLAGGDSVNFRRKTRKKKNLKQDRQDVPDIQDKK